MNLTILWCSYVDMLKKNLYFTCLQLVSYNLFCVLLATHGAYNTHMKTNLRMRTINHSFFTSLSVYSKYLSWFFCNVCFIRLRRHHLGGIISVHSSANAGMEFPPSWIWLGLQASHALPAGRICEHRSVWHVYSDAKEVFDRGTEIWFFAGTCMWSFAIEFCS